MPRLEPGGTLVSTDVAPEMVEIARRRASELGLAGIEFAVADAAALGFTDRSFDGILCRFGLMLVPELDLSAAEMARVVRPGGRVALAVWAEAPRNPWMTAAGRAAVALGFAERPDPLAPGPFRLADAGALEDVLERAGLAVEAVEDVDVTWRSPSREGWWEVISDLSPTLGGLLSRLNRDETTALAQAAGDLLEAFEAENGALVIPGVARAVLARR